MNQTRRRCGIQPRQAADERAAACGPRRSKNTSRRPAASTAARTGSTTRRVGHLLGHVRLQDAVVGEKRRQIGIEHRQIDQQYRAIADPDGSANASVLRRVEEVVPAAGQRPPGVDESIFGLWLLAAIHGNFRMVSVRLSLNSGGSRQVVQGPTSGMGSARHRR